MTTEQTLFDLEDLTATPAEEYTPKSMRELLFAGLILDLEDAIERERPASDPDEYLLDPDGSPRSGSPYWQAWHRASGIQAVLYLVRNRLATHEEYLVAERERTNATWSQREIECARHQDACPRCTETRQGTWKAERDVEKAERTADRYLGGILNVRMAIARAAEAGAPLTAGQVDKMLGKAVEAVKRQRQSGLPETPAGAS